MTCLPIIDHADVCAAMAGGNSRHDCHPRLVSVRPLLSQSPRWPATATSRLWLVTACHLKARVIRVLQFRQLHHAHPPRFQPIEASLRPYEQLEPVIRPTPGTILVDAQNVVLLLQRLGIDLVPEVCVVRVDGVLAFALSHA